MTRHRRLRLAASTALLALALAGCSGAGAPAVDATGSPASSATELGGELTVFAAASLGGAFDELAEQFEAQHPALDVVPITYDGSSTLATQLVEGATADVFASADERTMATVADAGLLDGDAVTFATNVLEIAVQPGNPLGIDALDDLGVEASAHPLVVLCAPEVPCGHAAQTLFDRAGVDVAPASEEQNVSAVLTKVRAGEADAGLVYATEVRAAEGAVEGVGIDGADAATNTYPIADLAGAENPAAAREFVRFVRSAAGTEVLAAFGFGAP